MFDETIKKILIFVIVKEEMISNKDYDYINKKINKNLNK